MTAPLAQQAKLFVVDRRTIEFPSGWFGYSVAYAGDTAVIASTNVGKAYVYVRTGSTWSEQQQLHLKSEEERAWTVAISGDTIVIGSATDDGYQTWASVFVRAGTTWSLQQEITNGRQFANPDGCMDAAISGDTLLRGCKGAVEVFVRVGSIWALQQKLTPANNYTRVAIEGDAALIGSAQSDAEAPGDRRGVAYLMVRTGTTWSVGQKLTSADSTSDRPFGIAVALSADTAIITGQGRAQVYASANGTLTLQQALSPSDGPNVNFGNAVAVSGDAAIIGAPVNGPMAGAAYIFSRSGTAWTELQKLGVNDALPGTVSHYFGQSVALTGDGAIVGASDNDRSTGAAYVFGPPNGIVPPASAPNAISPNSGPPNNFPTYRFTRVPGATHYYLWMPDVFWQRVTAEEAGCAAAGTQCAVNRSIPLPAGGNTAFSWRVQAQNAAGAGPWSNTLPVFATEHLLAPTPLEPKNITITAPKPIFRWTAVPRSTMYKLWVSNLVTGSSESVRFPSSANCDPRDVCRATADLTLAPGLWRWWVRAEDPTGIGPWSQAATFTFAGSPPAPDAAPMLVAPLGTTTGATPTFSWNTVANAVDYYLWIDDRSGPRLQQFYTAQAAGCTSGSPCSVTPSTVLSPGVYKWWVLARNTNGAGPWSSPGSFSVGSLAPPGVPTLLSPIGTVPTSTVSYRWTPVSDASEYELSVNGAGHTFERRTVTSVDAGCDSGTCVYQSSTALATGSATWWLRPANAAGPGAWVSQGFVVAPQGP